MSNSRPTGANPLDVIGAFFDVTGGLGDFIANGNPDPDSIPGVIQQRYRDHCDSWSRGELWVANINPADRAVLSSMCNPWLDSQGSGDPTITTPTEPDWGLPGEFYDFRPYGGVTMALNPPNPGSVQILDYEVLEVLGPASMRVRYTLCSGSQVESFWNPQTIRPTRRGACFGGGAPWEGDPDFIPPPSPAPNPNPRPDPGLPPGEEPFIDPRGRPVTPMPPITDPFGNPVQLPNIPLPNPFAPGDEPLGNPNDGPEPEPSTPIDGSPDGTDDSFGDPPEDHIWVGFTVRVSDQGLAHGSWANTGDEPVYREPTGVARPVFDFDGDSVLGNPIPLSQELSSYWIEAAGLPLSGARVSILGNETYSITPYSQPKQETE